jgi:hypothetical protein
MPFTSMFSNKSTPRPEHWSKGQCSEGLSLHINENVVGKLLIYRILVSSLVAMRGMMQEASACSFALLYPLWMLSIAATREVGGILKSVSSG